MKCRLPLLLLLLLALLPVSASAVGMVTEATYDAGKLVLTAYVDAKTVTVESGNGADVVLVLDTSSVMDTNGAAYLEQVKAGVKGAISEITNSSKTGDDRVAIISYADLDGVKETVGLTEATEIEKIAVNRLGLRVWTGSGTNVGEALAAAGDRLGKDELGHDRIVILLFDSGVVAADPDRAVAAVGKAKELKDGGIKLFCVDYAASGTAQGDLAAALSSDHPAAMAAVTDDGLSIVAGARAAEHFSKTTDLSVSGDFAAVLAEIVGQMGGTVYRPDATTELRYLAPQDLALPPVDQIRVRAEECVRIFEGKPAEWEERALLTGHTVRVEGQTVVVSGFDHAANAVHGNDGVHGARLVVEIPLTWSEGSGSSVVCSADSGVFLAGTRLTSFQRVSVTVTAKTYTVVHQRTDGTTAAQTTHHILSGKTDDLTTKVSTGYLYGGPGANTTWAAGESAVSFTPKANATYTVREVPATYLQPSVYTVWREDGGERVVTGLYLLTTTDAADQRAVGFTTGRGVQRDASLCDTVTVKAGGEVVDRLFVAADGRLSDGGEEVGTGRIGLYRLKTKEFDAFRSAPLCFRPWWITQDGVRVTGSTVWICTHRGPGTGETYGSVAIEARTLGSRTTAVEE